MCGEGEVGVSLSGGSLTDRRRGTEPWPFALLALLAMRRIASTPSTISGCGSVMVIVRW
jgi:hypothetical protein